MPGTKKSLAGRRGDAKRMEEYQMDLSVPRLTAYAAAGLLCVTANVASAASVSYFLDHSNENALLPDGTNYLKVTISDSISNPGDIEFLVETLSPLSSIADDNYGIQSFGFNSTETLTGANIVDLPSGWGTSLNSNQDGFGKFDVESGGPGSSRVDPLAFRITGITGDTLGDYAAVSSGNASEGNVFFAAHVAAFSDVDPGTGSVTGAFFGGSTVVPVPAAVWLFGSGLLGLIGIAKKKAA